MNRFTLKTLVVGDDDLNCTTGKIPLMAITTASLMAITTASLNFVDQDLREYDLIVYQGKKGCKILRNRAFRTGKVG